MGRATGWNIIDLNSKSPLIRQGNRITRYQPLYEIEGSREIIRIGVSSFHSSLVFLSSLRPTVHHHVGMFCTSRVRKPTNPTSLLVGCVQ